MLDLDKSSESHISHLHCAFSLFYTCSKHLHQCFICRLYALGRCDHHLLIEILKEIEILTRIAYH